jgi:hypothetical protein
MGINQTSNLANSSNVGTLPQVSGFTFVVNPMICTGCPFLPLLFRTERLNLKDACR